jgi:hypothetical protein
VLAAVEDGPGDAAGVFALEEEGLGFAILEAEDLAVATDVKFTLQNKASSVTMSRSHPSIHLSIRSSVHLSPHS